MGWNEEMEGEVYSISLVFRLVNNTFLSVADAVHSRAIVFVCRVPNACIYILSSYAIQ